MGSIVGLIDREGCSVGEKIVEMLGILRHRGPDSVGIASRKTLQIEDSLEAFGVEEVDAPIAIGCNTLNLVEKPEGEDSPLSCLNGLVKAQDGEFFDEAPVFRMDDRLSRQCSRVVREVKGAYVFAILYGGRVYLVRDPTGAKPLFIGENRRYVGFASERKALWRVGINRIAALQPGGVAVLNAEEIETLPASPMVKAVIRYFDMATAALEVRRGLWAACKARAHPKVKRVGVLFSGGLDSSILAHTLRDLGFEVVLYVGGLEGSHDVDVARSSADELGLKLREGCIHVGRFEDYLHRVVYAIEGFNPMDVGIAIPICLASERAQGDGVRLCLSGQGCDELFGGYSRYLEALRGGGYNRLRDVLWCDVGGLAEGMGRDGAAAMANSVELRSPFIDRSLIEIAMGIAPELKVASVGDNLRKLVLRRLAEDLGLPKTITTKIKKAAQYGSGAEKALRILAREKRYGVNALLTHIFEEEFVSFFSK